MSKAGVFTGPSGVIYRDRKRHLWFSSLFVPAIVFVGPALYFATGNNALMLWLPLAFYYLTVPVLDMLIGEDTSNPPEEVVPQLENLTGSSCLYWLRSQWHRWTPFKG